MVNNGQEDFINLDDEAYLNYAFVNENNGGENIEGENDTVVDNGVKNNEGENDIVVDNGVKNSEGKSDTVVDGHKKIAELTAEDIRGLEFASEKEACEFYRMYAKCVGFVTRKDDVGRDVKGNIIMRQLVCNREGLRDKKHYMRVDRVREHRPVTRTNCPARFRVHLDYKTSTWKVVSFEESHNHELTPVQCNDLVPVNRSVGDAAKAQTDSLPLFGVRTYHIMGSMLGQKGGRSELGFCIENLCNHIDRQEQAKLQDSDAFAALCYLQARADNDPMFYCKFTTTTDGKLQHLFWADGASQLDYECFGDVVALDTTYKRQNYIKPLVIFGGYNHHGEIVIFGCALVADEGIETYKWILKAFAEAMHDKHPNAVVTDGDGMMREAIRDVFPYASHRLCSWHLHQNAIENVKNAEFVEDLKFLIYSNLTPDGFESDWNKIIHKYGVANNKWVNKVYQMKTIWATTFMRDEFCAGIRTTLLCGNNDSFIKRYVQSKSSLVDFLHNFESVVKEYRHNELISDFESTYLEPMTTTALYKIEAEASKIFTRNKFKEVKSEIESAAALNVVDHSESDSNVRLKINKFCSPNIEYLVVYDKIGNRFQCDCRMFECYGIPCCHVFCAMKFEHMDVIPSTLICKRWTKSAKMDYISSMSVEEADSQKIMMLRKGALAAACDRLCNLAAKQSDDFLEISEEIYKLTVKIEKGNDPSCKQNTSPKFMDDPTVIRTKGAPRNRQCSRCKETGHTIRRCPQLLARDGSCSIDEEVSSSNCDTISHTNVDASFDQSCGRHATSFQVSKGKILGNSGAGASKRKQSNMKSSTQNSVKDNLNKLQKVEFVDKDVKIDGKQPFGFNNVSLHPTKRLAMYPPYPGIPLYPPYPGLAMYPRSPCFGLYPLPPFAGVIRKEQHAKKNP